jgi:hypothetical protein
VRDVKVRPIGRVEFEPLEAVTEKVFRPRLRQRDQLAGAQLLGKAKRARIHGGLGRRVDDGIRRRMRKPMRALPRAGFATSGCDVWLGLRTMRAGGNPGRDERSELLLRAGCGRTLCGFSLRQDLQPAEVAVHSWPGYVAGEELYGDIIATLADLIEERPDAAELLRGRSFARQLQ